MLTASIVPQQKTACLLLHCGRTRLRPLYKTDELNQSNSSSSIGKERISLSRNWPGVRGADGEGRGVCVCVCVLIGLHVCISLCGRRHLCSPVLHKRLTYPGSSPLFEKVAIFSSCVERSAPLSAGKQQKQRFNRKTCILWEIDGASSQSPAKCLASPQTMPCCVVVVWCYFDWWCSEWVACCTQWLVLNMCLARKIHINQLLLSGVNIMPWYTILPKTFK